VKRDVVREKYNGFKMGENKINTMVHEQDGEVDFIFLAQKLWLGRKFIGKLMLVLAIFGIIYSLLLPNVYTAYSTMVPQISDPKSKMGSLSGLAAMAGISMNAMGSSELTPGTYPQIITSVPFQLELMNTPINFKKFKKPITLYEYYTKYRFVNPIVEYTIGLPHLVIKTIKGKSQYFPVDTTDTFELTEKQKEVQKIMEKNIGVTYEERDGYVTVFSNMPDDYAAAQLAKKTQMLLQRYITEFKVEKAKSNLEFIQQRYDEAKVKYRQAQEQLAVFRDHNKNVSTAVVRTEQERLTAEYSLVFGVFSELAKKLEQAKLEVKEETPVFTIIKPVSVPSEKSKPKRFLIVCIFVFMGLVLGVVIVLGRDYADLVKSKWRAIKPSIEIKEHET
jgi:uncharacterized protein involved in exopolysaccharide biosynthesis